MPDDKKVKVNWLNRIDIYAIIARNINYWEAHTALPKPFLCSIYFLRDRVQIQPHHVAVSLPQTQNRGARILER
jgi:hypothetical protein